MANLTARFRQLWRSGPWAADADPLLGGRSAEHIKFGIDICFYAGQIAALQLSHFKGLNLIGRPDYVLNISTQLSYKQTNVSIGSSEGESV
jgi:hypothetical protein